MGTPKGSVPWNAGTSKGWTDKRGYRWLYVNENGRKRARREHRVLMERHLCRRLEPWEIVHHRDGNPSNNSLDNLVVMEFGKHTQEHSTGSRKSTNARRSMEAFALMRQELIAERAVKADLLEALETALTVIKVQRDLIDRNKHDAAWNPVIEVMSAAIAKATGQS